MNPFLWVLIAIFAVDALREYLGLSSLAQLADFVFAFCLHG
ncbi:KPN_01571 family protein [Lelliottia sp. CFBP8978]